jgi:type I restriction enzyme S subunit
MSGLAYKKDALAIKADKMVRVLRGGNIGEEQFYFKGDDVFISSELVKPELYLRKNYMITPAVSSLDHIGKIALIDKDYSDTVVGGFVLMLIPHFNDDVVSEYLLYAFAAKHHRDNCRNITHKSGQAFYNLSREQMMNLPVPIPPREEMGRIIAMLKRVLPRVADYAVVDTALQNLNGSFPEALKKSILQEAVQGKLVPQDPSDEPAEALLERIRAEKQRLIKEGKIKKDKHESVIFRRDNSHYEKRGSEEVCIDDEIPFEVPPSWALIRLDDIGIYRKGPFGSSLTKSMFVPKGADTVKVYEQKNAIQKDHTLGTYYITRQYYESKMRSFTVEPGDILVSCAGTIGETYVLPEQIELGIINQALMRMTIFAPIDLDYFLLYFDYVLKQTAKESSKGSAIKNIPPFEIFKKLILPLPPLEEQKRIVEKVRELESLCNSLCS